MSSAINPNSAVPLYKQIANVIAQDIKEGKYNYGDRLPSELTLKDTFGVSRITIRAAISELIEEGLLVRSQGKGTFIARPKAIMPASDHPGFTQSCLLAGRTPSTKLLSIDYTYPSPAECLFLNLKETDRVIVSKRLRFIENYPTVIETNHYITDLDFLFNENLNGSLFEVLSNHDIYVAESHRTLEICTATRAEADMLEIKLNTPLLLFKDMQIDQNGRPIYISKQLYTTERMAFYL